MKKIVALVLFASILTGCQTVEEMNAQDDAKCRSYGAEFGSPAYYHCRMMAEAQRQYEQERTGQMIQDVARQWR